MWRRSQFASGAHPALAAGIAALGIAGVAELARAGGSGVATASQRTIPEGARAAALGAYVAVADDPAAVFWNSAGLSQIRAWRLEAMHAVWLQRTRSEMFAAAGPLAGGVFALGVTGLSASIPQSDVDPGQGVFDAGDLSVGLGFGRHLTGGLSAGGVATLVRKSIAERSSVGAACDLGMLVQSESGDTRLGLSARNLGSRLSLGEQSDPLPALVDAGASMRLADFLVAAAARFELNDRRMEARAGIEYATTMGDVGLAARLGYAVGAFRELSGLTGLSAGAGFAYRIALGASVRLDYAAAPFGVLGVAHRVSAGVSFRPQR